MEKFIGATARDTRLAKRMSEVNPNVQRPPFCKTGFDINDLDECPRYRQIAKIHRIGIHPEKVGPNVYAESTEPCIVCCQDYFDKGVRVP